MAKSQLTKDYFVSPLEVAQTTENSVVNNLNWFIDSYEEEMIILLLGQPLYDAYKAGMLVGPPEAKWTALDLKLYQTAPIKVSPCANYVYWFYQRSLVTRTTGSGEKLLKSENSTNVGNAPKVKLMWNKMVKLNKSIINWLVNSGNYTEYVKPIDQYNTTRTPEGYQLYKDRVEILTNANPFF